MASSTPRRAFDAVLGWSAARHSITGLIALTLAIWAIAYQGEAVAPQPIQSITLYVLFTLAMAGVLHQHQPLRTFGGANRMTLFRLVVTCLLAGYIGRWPQATAVALLLSAIATVALVLDGFDGWWARRSHTASAFGARFDMEVDALLILVLAALAWGMGKAGAWILLAGLLRYLFVAAAMVAPWMRAALPPQQRRRLICAIQGGVLAGCIAPFFPPSFTTIAAAGSLALTIWSFATDTLWLYQNRDKGEPV
ncbi:MAG: CDP-alcohol phosphatidyltransferase family protein [Proteobacteria bacterium]|nr:CDP-alcohol phosphatidyltransferase family protein [Pseudomonadota bacterium]